MITDYDQPDREVLPCVEKIAFDTQRQASAAANVAEFQHGAHVKPYICQYCGLWHLASA
jgi:hypothetical protein